jgi:hypothetical protein
MKKITTAVEQFLQTTTGFWRW